MLCSAARKQQPTCWYLTTVSWMLDFIRAVPPPLDVRVTFLSLLCPVRVTEACLAGCLLATHYALNWTLHSTYLFIRGYKLIPSVVSSSHRGVLKRIQNIVIWRTSEYTSIRAARKVRLIFQRQAPELNLLDKFSMDPQYQDLERHDFSYGLIWCTLVRERIVYVYVCI